MIQARLVWELARKDLQLFAADRRGMLLCFGVPILLASMFGAVFHRTDSQPARPHIFVVTSPGAEESTRALCQSEHVEASQGDRETARRWLASESSGVVVVLPTDLDRLGGAPSARPAVELWHAPGSQLESRWVEGVLTGVLLKQLARRHLGALATEEMLQRPFTIERKSDPAGTALSVNAYSHSFCGMTLQYLLFWGMDSGLLLLRERRLGIWRRLQAAPISPLTLLLGKAFATALIALAQIAMTFLVGMLVFGVRINGSWPGFALMALALALLSASVGLMVAAMGGNETRARSVSILVILTLSLLGGLWLPAFLLPGWAQTVALGLPTTWAARGLEGVTWQGMDLRTAWPCALVLVGYSAAFLTFAGWRLSRA